MKQRVIEHQMSTLGFHTCKHAHIRVHHIHLKILFLGVWNVKNSSWHIKRGVSSTAVEWFFSLGANSLCHSQLPFVSLKVLFCQAWWCMLIIPAHGRQWQTELCWVEGHPCIRSRSRPSKVTVRARWTAPEEWHQGCLCPLRARTHTHTQHKVFSCFPLVKWKQWRPCFYLTHSLFLLRESKLKLFI